MRPDIEPRTAKSTDLASGATGSMRGHRRGARILILLGIALAASLVAGAASTGPGRTDQSLLRGFQIRVLGISQAAAENRMDGALAAIQALEKDLGEAASSGQLSADRYNAIESALATVRADITAHVAATAPPAAPGDNTDPALSGVQQDAQQDNGPVPVEPAVDAAAPAAAQAADPPGPGRSNTAKDAKGKAKGKP